MLDGTMQRSSPLYGGPSVTVPPLLAPLSNAEQQQQQQQHQQHYDTMAHQSNQLGSPSQQLRGTLKRKLPIVELDATRYAPPYSPITDAIGGSCGDGGPNGSGGPLKTKPRKESISSGSAGCGGGVELHEFPAFGQAFQGVSGIGQFYVIGPNDTNNNAANALTLAGDGQQHLHQHGQEHMDNQHHHQLATYIYDVPAVSEHAGVVDGSTQVVPITEHHLVSTVPASDVVHHTNGIVLTDISSSTWTSTAELLDLDRKPAAPTVPTNVHHHRYSIISTDHHHHHHQQQQQQHPQHQQNHHQNQHQQNHQHQHQHHAQQQQHHHQQQQQQQQCLVTQHHQHLHQHHHHHPHPSHQSPMQQQQQQQQLHMHHQPTSQQQPPSCPSSPRPSTTPTTVSSPSHPVPTSQHHSNNQPPAGHQYVPQQYAAGDAGSPYGNNTGNNQSGGSWPNPTAPTDAASAACSATSADGGAGGSSSSISPRMEPSSGGLSNATQTPDTPEDCKNLSWLLNFKLDDIPNLSPRSNRKQRSKSNATGGGGGQGGPGTAADSTAGVNASVGGDHGAVAIEDGDLNVGENVTIESSSGKSPKKPPFTYTELIEYALEEQGDLTVAAIYQWISDHFPYYKSHDDRWKNSVRHNLSINPHFRKGRKSSHGSGHLWTISSRNSEDNFLAWEHKKQRFEWFFKMEANARVRELGPADAMTDDEVAAATASLAQYVPKSPPAGSGSPPACQTLDAMNPVASEQNHHLPAQTLQQHQQHQQQHQQQQQQHQTHQQIAATYHQTQTLYADIITTAQFEVTTTAEEIGKHPDEDTLNGLRRGTEIQIVRPAQTIQTYEMLDTEYSIADYLNPVPKEEIVQECGLRSVALDPAELGINIPSATGQDEDILFDDFNLNYFGNNIMT